MNQNNISNDTHYSLEISSTTNSPIRRRIALNDIDLQNIDSDDYYDNKPSFVIKILCLINFVLFISGLIFQTNIIDDVSPPIEDFYFMTMTLYPECKDIRYQLWRPITSTLCHAGILHIFFNLIGLYILGDYIERKINYKVLIFIYLIGAIYGCLFNNLMNPYAILVGCSGSVYSLIGCYFSYKYINFYYNSIKSNCLSIIQFTSFFLLEFLTTYYFYNSRIAYYTHWISLIQGFIYSIFIIKNKNEEYNPINLTIAGIFIFLSTFLILYYYIINWPGKNIDYLNLYDQKLSCCYYKFKNESCSVIY